MSFSFQPQYQAISDASKSDERKRRNLQDLYKKTATFLDKLDTKVKIAVQERFGDFKATLEENMTNLLPRNQYPVLVAGKILISYNTKNALMSETATSGLQVTEETKTGQCALLTHPYLNHT